METWRATLQSRLTTVPLTDWSISLRLIELEPFNHMLPASIEPCHALPRPPQPPLADDSLSTCTNLLVLIHSSTTHNSRSVTLFTVEDILQSWKLKFTVVVTLQRILPLKYHFSFVRNTDFVEKIVGNLGFAIFLQSQYEEYYCNIISADFLAIILVSFWSTFCIQGEPKRHQHYEFILLSNIGWF